MVKISAPDPRFKKSVLFVEDEKDVQELLRYNLEKEGFKVLLSASGEEGYETAKARKPNLVILDLMLPGMDGFEVCRLLKADPATRTIPVMVLTARDSEADEVVGLELGASDYLRKPFSLQVLISRVKNLLRAPGSAQTDKTALSIAEFVLDREAVTMTAKGRSISLTKMEFNILAFLMENNGKVMSRADLVEAIWGKGAVVNDININMHIRAIRHKLGKSKNCIETVRGYGYRFAAGSKG